jgi:AhpD family alkylhydroperoxidase
MKLDKRIIRLIAVGASVGANCQPCLQINVTKALECGANGQEIAEAIEVGKMVRQGAASKMDAFAEQFNQAEEPASKQTNENCGCSQTTI